MKSLLKKGSVFIESLDREVEVKELSYKAQMEIMKAYNEGEQELSGLIMIKHGVAEFAEETLDTIGEALPVHVVVELGNAVAEFSGMNEDIEKK
jgi:hypothetical protein